MEIKQTAMPAYLGCDNIAYEYEPSWCVTALGWYNISQCARKRMTDNAHDVTRWRGSRRSFYNALRMMQVDEVQFMDD